MNLILFGFKACGKTHFGKRLSLQMHRPFIDTDDLLAELYFKETGKKRTPRQLYVELGAETFRALETKALHLLKNVKNSIIALGGGTVLNPNNIPLLQEIGEMVYLKTAPDILKERIFRNELPSFLDPQAPETSFYQMIRDREPIYRSIPARSIDTDLLDEAGVLAALHSILLLEDPGHGF